MTGRDPREANDDSHKSWALAIAEMRCRVFDPRKIEAELVEWFRNQGRHVVCVEGDWFASKYLNLTALAKHLAQELGGSSTRC